LATSTRQQSTVVSHLLPSLILAMVATVLICWNPFGAPPQSALLHVALRASGDGVAKLDTDIDGFGLGMRPAISAPVAGGPQVNQLRFDFIPGRLCALVFTPLDRPGAVEIQRCWLTTATGRVIAEIPPSEFTPGEGDSSEIGPGGALRLRSPAATPLKPVKFQPPVPIDAAFETPPSAGKIFVVGGASLAVFFLISVALDQRRERWLRLARGIRDWTTARPRRAILLAAILSTVIGTFPVIFCGKSFVSPDNGVQLLYEKFPTVPGAEGGHTENPAGSDLQATMYWGLPASVLEHRAIFQDGEFPLWSRYGWAGDGFLCQGMSMIGDPVHVAVILAGSKAWAWDAKFIVARILFALGIGLLVLRTSRSLPAALLLTLSAPFMGFFFYRFCHVANFSLCYSPWILLAWMEGAQAPTMRRASLWAGFLIFADWWQLNSGTAKECSALLLFLNATGGLVFLLARESWRWRAARLALFGWASVLFLLLSAPLWYLFLDSLGKAWTVYDTPKIYQLQPGLLIGLFDDIFLRQFVPLEYVFSPSANFFVLLGAAWAMVRLRVLTRDRVFLAIALAAFFVATLAFGVVSPGLLAKIPMLRNVSHFDNTFSCVLFTLLFILAGFGLREGMARVKLAAWRTDWMFAMTLVALLLAAYFGLTQASHRVGRSFFAVGETLPKSAFFMVYVPILVAAIALLPWAGRQVLLRRTAAPAWALAGLCLFAALHFRHGMYGQTKFDLYVMNPKKRLDLQSVTSPALARLHTAMAAEPARVLGLDFVMTAGFSTIQGWESPTSADALMNPRMLALVDALGIPRVDGWRIVVHHDRFEPLHRSLDMLNVRYLLSSPDQPDLPAMRLLTRADLVLEESETVWPRAFFTDAVGVYSDVAELGRMVREGNGHPFAAMPAAEQAHLPAPLRRDVREPVLVPGKGYRLTNNATSFEIDAPSPGLAVLQEANVPGDIEASVDGQPADCLTVNHVFRGVVIESPGHHVVQFRYWPAVLSPALSLSAVGLVCLLLSAWMLRRNRPVSPPAQVPEESLSRKA